MGATLSETHGIPTRRDVSSTTIAASICVIPIRCRFQMLVPSGAAGLPTGEHGTINASTDRVLSSWPGRLKDWLDVHGLLKQH